MRSIDNCYSIGLVNGDNHPGGFVGELGSGIIANCFYNSETSGQSDTTGNTTPRTTEQMQDVDTSTDVGEVPGLTAAWDFVDDPNDDVGISDIWNISGTINSGYPYLDDLEP